MSVGHVAAPSSDKSCVSNECASDNVNSVPNVDVLNVCELPEKCVSVTITARPSGCKTQEELGHKEVDEATRGFPDEPMEFCDTSVMESDEQLRRCVPSRPVDHLDPTQWSQGFRSHHHGDVSFGLNHQFLETCDLTSHNSKNVIIYCGPAEKQPSPDQDRPIKRCVKPNGIIYHIVNHGARNHDHRPEIVVYPIDDG